MNNINYTNNVNFGARMDVRAMKIDKTRWNNISKIFEEKTAKQHPGERVFDLIPTENKKTIWIDSDNYISAGGLINEKTYDKLMKSSDEKIAGKFVKLFKLITKPGDVANKFVNKIEKYCDEDTNYKVFEGIESTIKKDSYKALNKDSFLKNLEVEMW